MTHAGNQHEVPKEALAVLDALAYAFAQARYCDALKRSSLFRQRVVRREPKQTTPRLPHPKARAHKVVFDAGGGCSKFEVFVLTDTQSQIAFIRREASLLTPIPSEGSAGLGALWQTANLPSTRSTIEYDAWPILWENRAHLIRIYGLEDKDHLKVEFSYYRRSDDSLVPVAVIVSGLASLMKQVLGKRPRLLEVTQDRHPAPYTMIHEHMG